MNKLIYNIVFKLLVRLIGRDKYLSWFDEMKILYPDLDDLIFTLVGRDGELLSEYSTKGIISNKEMKSESEKWKLI